MNKLEGLLIEAISNEDRDKLEKLLIICDYLHKGAPTMNLGEDRFTPSDLPSDMKYEEAKEELKRLSELNLTLTKTIAVNDSSKSGNVLLYMDGIQSTETIPKISDALLMPKFDGCTVAIELINTGKEFVINRAHTRGSDNLAGTRKCQDKTDYVSEVFQDKLQIMNKRYKKIVSKNISYNISYKNKELVGNNNPVNSAVIKLGDIDYILLRAEFVSKEKRLDEVSVGLAAGCLNSNEERFNELKSLITIQPFEIGMIRTIPKNDSLTYSTNSPRDNSTDIPKEDSMIKSKNDSKDIPKDNSTNSSRDISGINQNKSRNDSSESSTNDSGIIQTNSTTSSQIIPRNDSPTSFVPTQQSALEILKMFGLINYPYVNTDIDGNYNMEQLMEYYEKHVKEPIDGIVYCSKHWTYPVVVEETAKRVNYGKYKWKRSNARQTKIINVEYSIGKTGKITPILQLNPTIINNKRYSSSRTTFSNLVKFKSKCKKYAKEFGKGLVCNLVLKSDINPYVDEVYPEFSGEVEGISLITTCPYCGNDLKRNDKKDSVIVIECDNDQCPGINQYRLKDFLKQIGCKGKINYEKLRELIENCSGNELLIYCGIISKKEAEKLREKFEGNAVELLKNNDEYKSTLTSHNYFTHNLVEFILGERKEIL